MAYEARVVADSVSENDHRLTTVEFSLPKCLQAEFNTHRSLSKNSGSSRAIPLARILEQVKTDPVLPVYLGRNRRGMTADEELDDDSKARVIARILRLRDFAVEEAMALGDLELHKQTVNRYLEAFMWQQIIASGTNEAWSHFFALRDHKDAQPEMRCAAQAIKVAMNDSTPVLLGEGEWHLPLIRPDETEWAKQNMPTAVKLCVGRCAATSYFRQNEVRSREADLRLYEGLKADGHMSPFEHVARPMTTKELEQNPHSGNFIGWHQHRKDIPNEDNFSRMTTGA